MRHLESFEPLSDLVRYVFHPNGLRSRCRSICVFGPPNALTISHGLIEKLSSIFGLWTGRIWMVFIIGYKCRSIVATSCPDTIAAFLASVRGCICGASTSARLGD